MLFRSVVPSCRGINQDHPDSSVSLVSTRGHARQMRITCKSFYEYSVLPPRSGHVLLGVLPVSPAANVVEAFVEFPVVEVTRRHDTISARCVNQVFELYSARFPRSLLP